jgi:hypothetical protein
MLVDFKGWKQTAHAVSGDDPAVLVNTVTSDHVANRRVLKADFLCYLLPSLKRGG